MVLVSDKKYACETCIKGHRSSACKHTDRPLFEIKKKGRPVTQCEHCRELRKTKQVHVKCSCGSQDQGTTGAHEASHSKKGTPKLPATAAFPHGLPEALETLATLLPASDDSDHSGETSPTGCRCSSGGPCNCCVPRKPATRRRFSGAEPPKRDKLHTDSSKHHESLSPPLSSHVLARIAELRPVLPRPAHRQLPLDGSLHNPSSSVPHGHSIRHHNYDFSPYGRAYGYTHSDHLHDQKGSSLTGDPRTFVGRSVQSPQQTLKNQLVPDAWSSAEAFPSVCACGDSCMCPGCTLHNNPSITGGAAYASCSNPSTCAFCLDCTILSIPAGNPPPNIDSSSDQSQSQEFDEWLRQVALSSGGSNSASNFNPYELTTPQTQLYQNGRPRVPETPSPPVECCGGRCKCPRNSCACLPDCCGCCQGCQCGNHCNDARSQTTFAVSGERGSCCRKADSNSSIPSAGRRLPEFMAMTNIRNQSSASGAGVGGQGYYNQPGAFMDYSEAPSRSSSGSSLSSRIPTRPPSGPCSRSYRVPGYWGRVALPVVGRRRHTSDLPGAPVGLLPMQSPKGLVGLHRTRTTTRRWMQCASTREVCHGVNSYEIDVLVPLSFLRCACLLLVAHWFTDGHAVAVIALIYIFLLMNFLAFSRHHVLLDGRDRDPSRTSTEPFFPLPRKFSCTLLQQQIL